HPGPSLSVSPSIPAACCHKGGCAPFDPQQQQQQYTIRNVVQIGQPPMSTISISATAREVVRACQTLQRRERDQETETGSPCAPPVTRTLFLVECRIADALGDIIDSIRSNSSSFLFTSARAVLNAHVSLLFTVHCLLSDVPHPPHPPPPVFFARTPSVNIEVFVRAADLSSRVAMPQVSRFRGSCFSQVKTGGGGGGGGGGGH
ncbi:hypothetical protein NQZ68_025720, partial [Dissostichus eleginoides]